VSRAAPWAFGTACAAAVAALVALFTGSEPSGFEESEAAAAAAEGAGPTPVGAEPFGGALSALTPAEQEARRAREEAAAKAAEGPPCTRAEGVFGRVLDTRGAPLPGARVSLHAFEPTSTSYETDLPPLATAVADAQGAFLVGPAPDRHRLRVRGEAAGHAAGVAWTTGRGAHVDLILFAGGSVRLRIEDDAHAPVAGARVRHPTTADTLETGKDGIVLVDGVLPGPGSVRVTREGFAALMVNDLVVVAGQTVERTCVLASAFAVEGRVLDASDQGVVDAQVVARFGNQVVGEAKSGEDGKFRLATANGPGETVFLVATKEGHGPAVATVTLRGDAGPAEATLRLRSTLRFEGSVEDEDGRPVAGATVLFGRRWTGFGEDPSATTGEDGAFSIEVPPTHPGQEKQPVVLVAHAPGKGAGGAQAAPPGSGAPQPPLVIRLSGAGAVAGTVRDAAGRPVEGVQVMLTSQGSSAVPLASGAVRPPDPFRRHALNDPRVARTFASTDAQGAWRIDDVIAGPYLARATFEGIDRDAAAAPVVVRSGATETVDLTLGGGTTIEGTVVDLDGEPVAGATLQAQDPANRDGTQPRWAHARTDADGRFALRGVRGESPWQVQVHAVGYAGLPPLTARPGEKSLQVRLTALGWIEGVVTEEDRPFTRPFSVAASLVAGSGGESTTSSSSFTPDGMVFHRGGNGAKGQFSSADGRFRLRGLAAGSYTLAVSTTDGLVAATAPRVVVSDGCPAGPVEIALERGASLAGLLVDATTRQPAGRGWCSASLRGDAGSAGSHSASSQVDTDGRFLLAGLASGTYLFQAQTSTGVPIEEEVVLSRGRREERTFLATRGGTLRVVVVDAEGRPVPNAHVNLMTERGNHVQPNWEALRVDGRTDLSAPNAWQRLHRTDETGALERHLVPPGRIQVQVHAGGHPPAMPWVVVAADRTTETRVEMRAPGESGE
jgi:protocatechuate 3,4-dioxygenase beta subunit